MFISPAYAQTGVPGADMSFMFVMLAFMAIFYFLVLRPQHHTAPPVVNSAPPDVSTTFPFVSAHV